MVKKISPINARNFEISYDVVIRPYVRPPVHVCQCNQYYTYRGLKFRARCKNGRLSEGLDVVRMCKHNWFLWTLRINFVRKNLS